MRSLRSLAVTALLVLGSLGVVAATPGQADAYWYRSYGGYTYPYYWAGARYTPYSAYSPYSTWYGTYGGYYGRTYPYYTWSRTYPWGWYY